MKASNDGTNYLQDIVHSTGESFSLRQDGNWVGSNQLMDSVKALRANNPSNAKACTSSGGWGNSNSGGGGECKHSGWTS